MKPLVLREPAPVALPYILGGELIGQKLGRLVRESTAKIPVGVKHKLPRLSCQEVAKAIKKKKRPASHGPEVPLVGIYLESRWHTELRYQDVHQIIL